MGCGPPLNSVAHPVSMEAVKDKAIASEKQANWRIYYPPKTIN